MDQLSGILFHMHLMDPDFFLLFSDFNLYITVSRNWQIEL